MLVLTRREKEQIVVADGIVITVVRIAGGRVRLGIDAPRSVRVMRRELTTDGRGSIECNAQSARGAES